MPRTMSKMLAKEGQVLPEVIFTGQNRNGEGKNKFYFHIQTQSVKESERFGHDCDVKIVCYYYITQLSVAKPNPSIFSFPLSRVLYAVQAYPETNY